MIAEKLDRQIDCLEVLAKRNNGDLNEAVAMVVENMRAEVDRVRALETSGVIFMPESVSEVLSHA